MKLDISVRRVKRMADTLRKLVASYADIPMHHAGALEGVSRLLGFRNYNALLAAINVAEDQPMTGIIFSHGTGSSRRRFTSPPQYLNPGRNP